MLFIHKKVKNGQYMGGWMNITPTIKSAIAFRNDKIISKNIKPFILGT